MSEGSKWNGTPVGSMDEAWREWYDANAFKVPICRKRLASMWTCTLARGHTGTCVAHSESSGTVLEVNQPWDPRLAVPEGL